MASGSPVYGVRLLGEGVPYLEGSEDRLFEIVNAAPDRSSRSDDLAANITDWPSRYALSRLRPNLLLPLRVTSADRVLDVGCGTGALSRALAECGATVTGLEGSLASAKVAAARTSELVNCDIVSGSLREYAAEGHAGEFDLIVLCGVLEYTESTLGGDGGPQDMLAEAAQLLKADGALVLAIENQLGLKYLLGYPEDHRALPWIGIDGYRSGHNPARTWSRRGLAQLLSDAGLPEQEWLYPYPDYKLPTVVARHELFETEEGKDLLRLFVRNPVQDYSAGSMLTADAVSAFHTLLTAGLGPDTANSFLVVAGQPGADPGARIEAGSLWISSGERSAELMDRRVVRLADSQWKLISRNERAEVHLPPLVSVRSDIPVVLGSNLEDELVALASRANSPRALQPLLQEWWQAATGWLSQDLDKGGYHFDIMPRNFIRSSGTLEYVDREWVWTDEVPTSWALLRAMWFLVLLRLWPAGAMAGLSWHLTLGEAAIALAQQADPTIRPADLATAVDLESQLQSRVSGADPEHEREQLAALLGRPLTLLSARPAMAQILERPVIVEQQAKAREEQAALLELEARDALLGYKAELETANAKLKEMDRKLAWLRGRSPMVAMRNTGARAKRRLLG